MEFTLHYVVTFTLLLPNNYVTFVAIKISKVVWGCYQ